MISGQVPSREATDYYPGKFSPGNRGVFDLT